jgi:hypothetical protein
MLSWKECKEINAGLIIIFSWIRFWWRGDRITQTLLVEKLS